MVLWLRDKPSIDEMELWPDLVWRMSALLRAGSSPAAVFTRLALELPLPEPAKDPVERLLAAADRAAFLQARQDLEFVMAGCARQARAGLPVGQALSDMQVRRLHSRKRLAELAACWQVSEVTGAPLIEVLERLAHYYENDIDLYQARQSAMSGPKSTAHLLSWLPLLGLGLGLLMGTNPLGVLCGSALGALAAVFGLALACAGRMWTGRLVKLAERGQL